MIGYTPTPDYYRDYIEHGWVKDAAKKVHKYIKRWRGKAGKWYYSYKVKKNRIFNSVNDNGRHYRLRPEDISTNYGKIFTMKLDPDKGKSTYRSGREGSRLNAGIHAGRLRASKKGTNVKGYSGNLTQRGYSRAEGRYTRITKNGKEIERDYGRSGGWNPYGAADPYYSLEKKSKTRKAINAGRERVKNKKAKNLSQKGYSSSRG